MKKFLLLILTLTLFSCQNTQNQENNNSGKTENISEEIILPDLDEQEFLNSEENKINKEKAKECLTKVNKNNFDDTSYTGNIVQAFEYDGECYYLYISRLYYFPDTVFTTADIGKKVKYYEDAPYEVLVTIFDEIGPYDPTKPKRYYFETTPSFYLRSREFQPTNDDIPKLNYLDKRIHNEFCDNDDELQYSNLTYGLNLLINLDAIFEEYNIVPPRIIYSEDEFNEQNFLFIPDEYETMEKFKEKMKEKSELVDDFRDFLNYYYKLKNSKYFPEIKETFDRVDKYLISEEFSYFDINPSGCIIRYKDRNKYEKFYKYGRVYELKDLLNSIKYLNILLEQNEDLVVKENCKDLQKYLEKEDNYAEFYFTVDEVCYVFGMELAKPNVISKDDIFIYSSDKYDDETKHYIDYTGFNSYKDRFNYVSLDFEPDENGIIHLPDDYFDVKPDFVGDLAKTLKEIGIEKLPDDYEMKKYMENITQDIYDKYTEIDKNEAVENYGVNPKNFEKIENIKLKNLYEDVKNELKNIK